MAEDAGSKELPHTIGTLNLGKRYNVHLSAEKPNRNRGSSVALGHLHVEGRCSEIGFL